MKKSLLVRQAITALWAAAFIGQSLLVGNYTQAAIIPTIQFTAAGSSGSESEGFPNITVFLSGPSDSEVIIEYDVAGDEPGTAELGNDYGPPTFGIIDIPAGSLSASFYLSINEDSIVEGPETIRIMLGEPNNAYLGVNSVYTYTILDNDTEYGGGNGNGSWSESGSSAPAPSCPSLYAGLMVKVVGKAAIYAVNSTNKIMYFPSGDEFKSWNQGDSYAGLYTTTTQECFDSLSAPTFLPGGINFRPGSYIVKKEDNSQLYAVLPNNTLAKISTTDAKALYGNNFTTHTITNVFWPNYVNRAPDISGKAHTGMLVKKDGKTWYVEGLTLMEVTEAGMTANRFKTSFVRTITDPSYLSGFSVGSSVGELISSLADRTGGI